MSSNEPRVICLLALLLGLAFSAVTRAQDGVPAGDAEPPPYWAGPALSGSWYDPARSGEGIIVEILEDGSAVAMWFTYPAAGEDAEQAWLLAAGGWADGDTLRFAQVLQPKGARFGEDFDPNDVDFESWGTLELSFQDCSNAIARYAGPGAYGSGERTLTRLTHIDQIDCGGRRDLTPSGARALSGLRARSGAWYVPERSGEGWLVEDLSDGRSLVYWFTYDPDGRQAWTAGVGQRDGDRVVIEEQLIGRGTRFGEDFDAAAVQLLPWGRVELTYTDCDTLTIAYDSPVAGYGAGTRVASRLTHLAGTPCLDDAPAAVAGGSWVERASMPSPAQSEHAVSVLDGRLYALGGFGDPRGFKRYDPSNNQWSVLTPLPAGRHHLAAFALAGNVYMVGGEAQGGGDQSRAAFRYDVAGNRWEPEPLLQFMFGSHAATLHGRAYVGGADGTLQEFDPRQQRARRIPRAPGFVSRDHSQVVALLGEIWMIGGRSPETTAVAIYDPVSESWRAGPPLLRRRAGFAAASTGDRIVVGGGEILFTGMYLESTVEVYTAGDTQWQSGPSLPMGLHGVAAGLVGGRVHVVSGSTLLGSADGATGRLYALDLQLQEPSPDD